MKTLPNESKMRYHYPISSGCLAYFPAALAGVAKHSYIGGAKYNDGALVHLRYISTEHLDCIGRHLLDLQDLVAAKGRGATEVETYVYDFETKQDVLQMIPIDEAILIECNALSWRSLAFSQEQHEKLGNKPLAPAARLKPPADPYKPINLTDFGRNKVGVVKALREINQYSLKEAVDIVNGLPHSVDFGSRFTRQQALACLIAAGATAE
jgi:ribosomal protein L7/L12